MGTNNIKERQIRGFMNAFGLTGDNYSDTASRVVNVYTELLHREKPTLQLFPFRGSVGMILVRNHVTWSLCPHHLLPVTYKIHIGYIPNMPKALGLSKPFRIADYVMSMIPLQEEVPGLILDILDDAIHPRGAGVVVIGNHSCVRLRGVESSCADAISSAMSGMFQSSETKSEFLSLLQLEGV